MECWSVEVLERWSVALQIQHPPPIAPSLHHSISPAFHHSVTPFLTMGQKTNPIGLRIAVTRDWRSNRFAGKKEFGKLLTEDRNIRELIKKKLETASVP